VTINNCEDISMSKDRSLFTDTVRGAVVATKHLDRFKDSDAISTSNASLLVKIAATHAGLRTGNKGFYLPERMRDGASTFVLPYKKPVLTHHDDFKDPIGRVQSARYVDLTHLYPQNDLWMQKLHVGGMKDKDLQKSVQYFLKNWQDREDYQGLGYIELLAEITDPDAIQKVLDNRYLTVSTAHSSDAAYCGVCMQNWVADGWCEHEPGNTYEDQECVLIPGKHLYSEVSYVNKPADREAKNVEILEGTPLHMATDSDFEPRNVDVRLFCKGPACILDMASEAEISLKDAEGPLEEVIDSMSEKTREQEVLDLIMTVLEDTSKDLPEELVKDEETLKLAHSLLSINCCDKEEAEYFDAKVELSQKLRDKATEIEVELEDNEVELQVKADAEADAQAADAEPTEPVDSEGDTKDADADDDTKGADSDDSDEGDVQDADDPEGDTKDADQDDDETQDADGQDGDSDEDTQDADQELLDLKDILDPEKSYEKVKEHLSEDNHLNEETLNLLKASDFAHPTTKSFPMHDCEHIDAALTVLEGYDSPGIKDAIVEVLDRRKKSMKCSEEDGKDKDECKDGQEDDTTEDSQEFAFPMERINDLIDLHAELLPDDDELLEATDDTEDLLDDEDAAKKRPQDKPGGSNVGKYKTGPFCGPAGGAPKGSYPVNTKKRAISALSYARHAPNPGGIKACVCKHWSSLPACKGGKDLELQELNLLFKDCFDEGTFTVTVKDGEVTIVEGCPACTEVTADAEAKDAKLEVQKDQLVVLEDDYRILSEENIQLTTELSNRLADRAIELRILSGESIEDVDAARDEFTTHSLAEMRDSVSKLEDAFDVDKAAERLNDGMASEPEGTVKDPTVQTDGGDAKSQGQLPSKESIMATFNKLHKRSGPKVAREWLKAMKDKFGEHLEFEDNHEEDNK
jgi:hypothetical protein